MTQVESNDKTVRKHDKCHGAKETDLTARLAVEIRDGLPRGDLFQKMFIKCYRNCNHIVAWVYKIDIGFGELHIEYMKIDVPANILYKLS